MFQINLYHHLNFKKGQIHLFQVLLKVHLMEGILQMDKKILEIHKTIENVSHHVLQIHSQSKKIVQIHLHQPNQGLHQLVQVEKVQKMMMKKRKKKKTKNLLKILIALIYNVLIICFYLYFKVRSENHFVFFVHLVA